jgi:cytochrome P450
MPTLAIEDLPLLDIDSTEYLTDPHGTYRRLRERGWAAHSKRGIELLRYQEIYQLLRDRRLYWPMIRMLELNGVVDGPLYDYRSRALIALAGDDHARMRRLALLGFNRRVIDDKRAGIRQLSHDLLDRAEASAGTGDGVDFNIEVAQPLPSAVFCLMIGAPVADAPEVARWSVALNLMLRMDPLLRPRIETACVELTEYVRGQIEQRRARPGDDLLSEFLKIQNESDRLTEDELVVLLLTILQGSTDSTSNQLSMTVGALCDHPDQWELVHSDPDLAEGAVEEGLRFAPRQLSTLRVCDEDLRITGGDDVVDVPARTMIVLCVSSANRDPAVFTDPDRFELRREKGRSQLSFGAGPHSCLGQMIARLEMEEVLRAMGERYSKIERSGTHVWNPSGGHAVEVDHLPIRMSR